VCLRHLGADGGPPRGDRDRRARGEKGWTKPRRTFLTEIYRGGTTKG
jgi:hypothetical protein